MKERKRVTEKKQKGKERRGKGWPDNKERAEYGRKGSKKKGGKGSVRGE